MKKGMGEKNAMEIFLTVGASVLVAVIGGVFSYLGVIKSSKNSHDLTIAEIKAEQEKQSAIIDMKITDIKGDIQRLEEKQDKHNSLIERTFKLEQKVEDLIKQIG